MKVVEPTQQNSITILLQDKDLSAWRKYVKADEVEMTFSFGSLRLEKCSTELPSWVRDALAKKASRQAYMYRQSLHVRKVHREREHTQQLTLGVTHGHA